jgi:hypothetical protein
VLALDVFLVLIALAGAKLLGLKQRTAGGFSILIGAVVLVLGIYNGFKAPPMDGIGYARLMPGAFSMNSIVYIVAISCMTVGTLMIVRSPLQKKLS